jgi:hypothetical protein
MFVAQVRWLDAAAGRDLVEQIVTRAHPSTWRFDDALLNTWPPAVAQRAVAAVRALPRGEARIEGLCRIAGRLTRAEQREALEGVLDGTFRERHGAVSRRGVIVAFIRTLPEDDREAWVRAQAAGQVPFLSEVLARRDVGVLTDRALRDLWRRVPTPARGEIPSEFYGDARWDLVPDDALDALLLRLRDDPYGWNRDELIEHMLDARPPSTADRLGSLLLEGLDDRADDTRLEIVRALTSWLADRTCAAMPRALAALPVPRSETAPDAQYAIARVHRLEGST